ncbi:hypothetical protein [Halorussus caseinilyticus]|uniref:Uncharacterized protein n=1 Tax=Halorussus caseinilyticus TaxID=3034025 RepID=A0ABD5WSD4_9EURY|nr:hypothetical protein [Halorussus sp. DT72]
MAPAGIRRALRRAVWVAAALARGGLYAVEGALAAASAPGGEVDVMVVRE